MWQPALTAALSLYDPQRFCGLTNQIMITNHQIKAPHHRESAILNVIHTLFF